MVPSTRKALEGSIDQDAHSKTSSHSNGFDISSASPFESSGNYSMESTESVETKTSLDAESAKSDLPNEVSVNMSAVAEMIPTWGAIAVPQQCKCQ